MLSYKPLNLATLFFHSFYFIFSALIGEFLCLSSLTLSSASCYLIPVVYFSVQLVLSTDFHLVFTYISYPFVELFTFLYILLSFVSIFRIINFSPLLGKLLSPSYLTLSVGFYALNEITPSPSLDWLALCLKTLP